MFWKTETPQKFLVFQESELSYTLGNGKIHVNTRKIPYISGETSKAPKTKTSYTSPKKIMNKSF